MLTSMITDKMRNAKNKVRTTLVAELVWERISPRPVRPNTDQIRLPDVLNKLKKENKVRFPYLSYLLRYFHCITWRSKVLSTTTIADDDLSIM